MLKLILLIRASIAPGAALPCEPLNRVVPGLFPLQFIREASLVRRLCLIVVPTSFGTNLLLLANLTVLVLTPVNKLLNVFDVVNLVVV